MTSEYRSDIPVSDMNPPFLRSLKTSKFPGTPLGPYLEQPNLVSGLPAQCKYYNLSDELTALTVCYILAYFIYELFSPL